MTPRSAKVLAWVRRTGALLMLVGFFLPVMTIQGCEASDPPIVYTGFDLVKASPLLAAMPAYFASVAALSLIYPRIRTPVGRLFAGLACVVWSGVAAVLVGLGFQWVPDFVDGLISPRPGFWLLLVGSLGAVGSDVTESVAGGRGWLAFVRSHPVPRLGDGLLKGAAVGLCVLSVVLALVSLLPMTWFGVSLAEAQFGKPSGGIRYPADAQGAALLHGRNALLYLGPPLLFGGWVALSFLTAWGLVRGRGWAVAAVKAGTGAAVVLVGVLAFWWTAFVTEGLTAWGNLRPENLADVPFGAFVALILLAGWLFWSFWTGWVVLVSRRWLFPAKRVRVLLPEGQRWVHIPRCDGCSARLWLSEDAAELICRSCGSVYRAAIRGPQVVATRTQQA